MSLVARLKGVRYYGIPKITEIPLFCKFLLHKKLVIHVLSPIMRFSAILRYAIAGFYCTFFKIIPYKKIDTFSKRFSYFTCTFE